MMKLGWGAILGSEQWKSFCRRISWRKFPSKGRISTDLFLLPSKAAGEHCAEISVLRSIAGWHDLCVCEADQRDDLSTVSKLGRRHAAVGFGRRYDWIG
jgi:hypothetical protein